MNPKHKKKILTRITRAIDMKIYGLRMDFNTPSEILKWHKSATKYLCYCFALNQIDKLR